MDDFSADINTTGVIMPDGTPSTGVIDFDGDDDWFAINVVAGEVYTIAFSSDTLFLEADVVLNLYDSSGNSLTGGSIDFNNLEYTATESGTIFVAAETGIIPPPVGSEYTLTDISDDFSSDINTTGVLTVDGVAATGSIETEFDEDWFAINIVAGTNYTVNIASDEINNIFLDLQLYNTEGIAIGPLAGSSEPLNFTATETGVFFVSAMGVIDLGDYTLTATQTADDYTSDVTTSGVLVVDSVASTGNIDFAGDSDWFAIDVVAGESYTVGFSSDTLFLEADVMLNLHDSSGNAITGGTVEFDNFIFTATETGTIFVSAETDAFVPISSGGEYSLTATLNDTFCPYVRLLLWRMGTQMLTLLFLMKASLAISLRLVMTLSLAQM